MIQETEKTKNDPALEFVWAQYRIYAMTSSRHKSIISRWRYLVFIFTILGAFFAVLAQNMSSLNYEMISKVIGGLSALSVGLAAYAGSVILTDEREKNWIRARSAAEAFKSQVYQYLLKVRPYDEADRGNQLFLKAEELLKSTSDISTIPMEQAKLIDKLPTADYNIDQYIEERVRQQIYQYYFPKAKRYDHITRLIKGITLVLGFISVVLGTLGSLGYAEYSSVWIAFISSFTGSAAAYMASNHYHQLVVSYQATSKRLMMFLARWSLLEGDDVEQQKEMVLECESILAMENGAWMTELSEKSVARQPAIPATVDDSQEEEVAP